MTNEFQLNRRELLASLLGVPLLLSGCADRRRLPPQGEIIGPSVEIGHRIRDARERAEPTEWRETGVLVVGGGIAGLSAAWRLQLAGVQDFTVLELEPAAGGTARSGRSEVTAYPWGAHYVPLPTRENRGLVKLLEEMDILERVLEDGTPVAREEYLCRDPQERLFFQGEWIEGLYAHPGASGEDRRQLDQFQAEVDRWVRWRDPQGRRAFAIPTARASNDPEVLALDQLSMAGWLEQRGLTSQRLRWVVDYSCRDDYGLTVEQTSAWAGLFYFAARATQSSQESQPLLTWPEGNGRIVNHLARVAGDRLQTGQAVVQLTQDGRQVRATVLDVATDQVYGLRAGQAIFAAPQFLTPYLISDLPEDRMQVARQFQYGSWLVANLHLSGRPVERRFPLCWDNVLYDSPSLGYVDATFQTGRDHGPTVVTWFYPCCADNPASARQRLLEMTWEECAELALGDLETAHPEIRDLVTRLDVIRWGHAMVQPRPGFLSGPARRTAARPVGSIHFAGTDLSGIALLEEALHHGTRAAEEILDFRGISAGDSLL